MNALLRALLFPNDLNVKTELGKLNVFNPTNPYGVFSANGITLGQKVAALFSAGEQGVWYDPSDFSTMFQDAAGTIPVTAVGQAVGLILSKHVPSIANINISSNPSYETGLGNSSLGNAGLVYWDSVNKRAILRNTGINYPQLLVKNLQTPLIVGETYQIEIWITNISCTSGLVVVQSNVRGAEALTFDGLNSSNIGVSRKFNYVITVSNSSYGDYWLYLQLNDVNTNGEVAIDDIKVQKLPTNAAYQTTSTKRPVLSARYNLLTKTEQFDSGVWVKDGGGTITGNATTAPDGTLTADMLVEPAGLNSPGVAQIANLAGSYTRSVYFKQGFGNRFPTIRIYKSDQNYIVLVVNLADGTSILKTGYASTFTNITSSVIYVGNGFYKASLTYSSESTTSFGYYLCNSANPSLDGNGTQTYTGDGTSGIYIWGASLVPADQASLPYQRVNTATDYDTTGFPPYLLFDGIDDALQTANVNFTGTDKVTVWAGVRKLSDSSINMIVELSTAVETTNPGSFYFASLTSGRYEVATRGTASVYLPTANNSFVAPITNVITSLFVISTDTCNFRANGALITSSSSDQGAGNYGNYPLYIGSRGGTTLRFNGRLYSLIIRGAQSTATEISNAETYVNSKTGAY